MMLRPTRHASSQSGVTLVELLVVLAVLTLVIGLIIAPMLMGVDFLQKGHLWSSARREASIAVQSLENDIRRSARVLVLHNWEPGADSSGHKGRQPAVSLPAGGGNYDIPLIAGANYSVYAFSVRLKLAGSAVDDSYHIEAFILQGSEVTATGKIYYRSLSQNYYECSFILHQPVELSAGYAYTLRIRNHPDGSAVNIDSGTSGTWRRVYGRRVENERYVGNYLWLEEQTVSSRYALEPDDKGIKRLEKREYDYSADNGSYKSGVYTVTLDTVAIREMTFAQDPDGGQVEVDLHFSRKGDERITQKIIFIARPRGG